jgi:hypothetical protein
MSGDQSGRPRRLTAQRWGSVSRGRAISTDSAEPAMNQILLTAWLYGRGGHLYDWCVCHILLGIAVVLFVVGLLTGRRTV